MEQLTLISVDYVICSLEHKGMVQVISRESRCISLLWLVSLLGMEHCAFKIRGLVIQHLQVTIVFLIWHAILIIERARVLLFSCFLAHIHLWEADESYTLWKVDLIIWIKFYILVYVVHSSYICMHIYMTRSYILVVQKSVYKICTL